ESVACLVEFAVADFAAVPDEGGPFGLGTRMVAQVLVQGKFALAPGGQGARIRGGVRVLAHGPVVAHRLSCWRDVPASRPMVASSRPASRRTSAVCSPRRGAGRRTEAGVAENSTGCRVRTRSPSWGWR